MFKIAIVAFKYASKPTNAIVKRAIVSRGKESAFRSFFVTCGQTAHKFEVQINRYIVKDTSQTQRKGQIEDHSIKVYIKPLSEDAAFNKGVDYFCEIVLLYGVLMMVAVYEVKKA